MLYGKVLFVANIEFSTNKNINLFFSGFSKSQKTKMLEAIHYADKTWDWKNVGKNEKIKVFLKMKHMPLFEKVKSIFGLRVFPSVIGTVRYKNLYSAFITVKDYTDVEFDAIIIHELRHVFQTFHKDRRFLDVYKDIQPTVIARLVYKPEILEYLSQPEELDAFFVENEYLKNHKKENLSHPYRMFWLEVEQMFGLDTQLTS